MASPAMLATSISTPPPSKSPIATRPPAADRLWLDEDVLALGSAADVQTRPIGLHKNSDASTIEDEMTQTPETADNQTFYYSTSHNSDSTYGSPIMADTTSPTKGQSKLSRSPLKKLSPRKPPSKYLHSDVPVSPRYSVSAAAYKRTTQVRSALETPTMPRIRSHASETALSDSFTRYHDGPRGKNSSTHARFGSTPSARQEYIPDDAFYTRAHHDALERKVGALEHKIDSLVPALSALTHALNTLAARFDDATLLSSTHSMTPMRGSDVSAQQPSAMTNFGLPTPATDDMFRLNSFMSERDRECDIPMFGSVSDRGTIRTDGSRTQSRRGSKPARIIATEIAESDELVGDLGSRPRIWTARQRSQSCFEPDTESEIDDVDDGDAQVSPARTVTNGSIPSDAGSSPVRLRHKESFNATNTLRNAIAHYGLAKPASPKKNSLRSAPPPPVKIPAYTSDYTVVAGPSGRHGSGGSHSSSSPPKRPVSPDENTSPGTAILSYIDRQVAFLSAAPIPTAPLTAGLYRSPTYLDDPSGGLSMPTSPARLRSALASMKPLAVHSATQVRVVPQPHRLPRPVSACIETTSSRNSLSPPPPLPPAEPAWYFFYGPLTDPTLLAELLHLPEPPVLQPARIHTHELRFFGPFPCAVPMQTAARELAIGPKGENRDAVEGKALFVSTADMAEWLRRHEDDEFVEVGCEIEFEQGVSAAVAATGSEGAEGGEAGKEAAKEGDASAEGKKKAEDLVMRVSGRMFEWRGSGDKLLAAPSI